MDLSTTYLGLKLRSPLVPSASPLTETLDQLKQMEDFGAGAAVLPSLFEEQIRFDQAEHGRILDAGEQPSVEALHYFPQLAERAPSRDEYLELITRAKQSLDMPIIASLNGATFGGWTMLCRELERAGADALELNFYSIPTDPDATAEDVEQGYLTILSSVKAQVKIPVAVKLSPFFTSPANFARRLVRHGADGLVLFNRFFQPDIDIESIEVKPNLLLSSPAALRLPLRWIALLSGRLDASLAATSGISDAADVVKLMMAGADVAMLCSALIKHGIERLAGIERELREWLERREYSSLSELRGCLSQSRCPDPAAFERAQYIRALRTFITS